MPGVCTFAEQPERDARAAAAFWAAGRDPYVLGVVAEPAPSNEADGFTLADFAHPWRLLCVGNREHLLIGGGLCRLRLDVVGGTLQAGPVRLQYQLTGFADLDPKILTLRCLLALVRLGRIPNTLSQPLPRAHRWSAMLRAYDLAAEGASQREIGCQLFGAVRIASEWRGPSDSLRLSVRRLLRSATAMVDGGYLNLLGDGVVASGGDRKESSSGVGHG